MIKFFISFTRQIKTILFSRAKEHLCVEVPGFNSPSIISGDVYHPDLPLASSSNSLLYVIELTVGYESNLYKNVRRKQEKYKEHIKLLRKDLMLNL